MSTLFVYPVDGGSECRREFAVGFNVNTLCREYLDCLLGIYVLKTPHHSLFPPVTTVSCLTLSCPFFFNFTHLKLAWKSNDFSGKSQFIKGFVAWLANEILWLLSVVKFANKSMLPPYNIFEYFSKFSNLICWLKSLKL